MSEKEHGKRPNIGRQKEHKKILNHANVGQQKSTPRDLTWSAKEHSKRLNVGQQKRTASDLMLVSIKEHSKRLNVS